MIGVVDASIGWLVQTILGSLFTEPIEAWARGVGIDEDVENLKSEMRNVQMVLAVAKGRRIENEPLARSLYDLKELLYDAEDVMDEVDYYRLQQQIEQGEGCAIPEESSVSSSTPSFQLASSSNTSRFLSWCTRDRKRKREEEPTQSTISERIKGIVDRLGKLCNSVREILQLEISYPIAMANQSQHVARNTRLTTSFPVEDKVYGRDKERDKIVELLINGKSSDLQVLPIVGIGGIGKTTLARFVYGSERIKEHFDLRMWVCVSTNFDPMRLTHEILEHVCTDRQQSEKITNFNVLQDILVKNLENKRFLLVFDDIWEEKDRRGWFSLLAPLKHNHVPGCMILATTRRPSVAKMIQTMDSVSVKGLDENKFWLFFKACAFGNENHEGHPSLQSIGQQIVKALKGIPLAARSVGALLNRNVTYEHWRAVQNKWKFLQEDTDGILPILKLSYDFLPIHLQHCFSYCSLFPEDYRFDGGNLVRAWISQNFVQCEDPSMRLEETGKQYLDDLVDLGFFQKVGSRYVMHDLMHELAQMVSRNECATINGSNSGDIQPSIRHLSIITSAYEKDGRCNIPCDKFENILDNIGFSKRLRTLMVFGRSSICLLRCLHTLCMKSKSLRFLRIYVTHNDVGSTVSFLNPCHLRYLEFIGVFSDTDIWQNVDLKKNIILPHALTKFYHLQFFNADIGSNISAPASMNNLINLRNIVGNEKVHSVIAGVCKLTSLQGLKFEVRIADEFGITQLRSMNKLVSLGISRLENVKTKQQASRARLIDKEYLQELSLSWNGISVGLDPCTARTEDVLEGLQPHENLKSLRISGYNGANSPTWLAGNVSMKMLQILHLENCTEWRILPLQLLPFLRKLKMIRMWNLMEISIPSLEELVMIEMPRLEKCLGTYGMELTTQLRVIIIRGCPRLNEFTPFQSYSSFHAEQKSWFPFLSKLAICYCPHIMNWEILPLGAMQALEELMLMDLHLVRELSVPSLKSLELIKMPRLERCSGLTAPPSLPSQEEQNVCLSSLCRLILQGCPSLMVSCPLPPSTHIKEISIKGKVSINMCGPFLKIVSSELSVLDDRFLAFHNLRGMTSLSIKNCPKLISISSASFSQLTGLVSLNIYNCSNLLKPPIPSEAASETIPGIPSLKHLIISSSGIAGGWLTKMLLHVRSLEELCLHDCPQIKWLSIGQPTEPEGSSSLVSVVALSAEDQTLLKVPPNILCSLKQLTISGYVDLEFYGSKGGFGGFTTLEYLQIGGCHCPKLGSLLVSGPKDDGTSNMDVALLPESLKTLNISSCPKLVTLLLRGMKDGTSNGDVGLLPSSLEYLSLSHLPENSQSNFLKGLADLRSLSLMDSPCLKSVQLHSCTALRKLSICHCEQLGALEGLQFLTTLESMTISRCRHLDVLEGLQFLTTLESLEIEMNPKLSAAWCQELEQGRNQIGLLPQSINNLVISYLTNNVQSRLLSFLPAITHLEVQKSSELISLQLGYYKSLTELKIRGCESLASLQLEHCTTLTELEIGDCKSLASLQLGHCTALTKLEIGDCESLASIEGFQYLTNLTFFRVAASSSLPPWMELLLQQIGACEVLSRLTELKIEDCESLTSLQLGHCTALTKLEIRDCESLASIEGFQSITNLRSFTLAASSSLPPWIELFLQQQQGACEVLSQLTELEIGDSSILIMSLCKQLTSLRCLKFNGKETSPMVSLSEEQESALKLLASLKELYFRGYPNLLLLPADLPSLASLKSLGIYSCPSISRLPEMAPSCELYVSDCSEDLSLGIYSCPSMATRVFDFSEVSDFIKEISLGIECFWASTAGSGTSCELYESDYSEKLSQQFKKGFFRLFPY